MNNTAATVAGGFGILATLAVLFLLFVVAVLGFLVPVFVYQINRRLRSVLVESEAIRAMMADQVYLQAKLLDSYGISPSAAVSQELTEAVALIAKERQPSHAPAHEVHEQLADN